MRPTIPLSDWKIAVDLERTRDIQASPSMPATGCTCRHCQNWKLVYKVVLPSDLVRQLARIGISPVHPSDAYGDEQECGVSRFRVWFHAVGKILSGPSGWVQKHLSGDDVMDLRNYVVIREKPYYVSMVVQPATQFYDQRPRLSHIKRGELIQIDFRVEVPWRR